MGTHWEEALANKPKFVELFSAKVLCCGCVVV
jgi:hypothetical protein